MVKRRQRGWALVRSGQCHNATVLLVVSLLGVREHPGLGNSITEYQEVLGGALSPPRPVERDLLGALLDERADPDAEVGGDDVRQAEARQAFELVDVELE